MATYEEAVPEQRPQRNWFGRNWWWVLLLVILGGGLVCAGICGGVFYFIYYDFVRLKEAEPYKMTIEALADDPTVVQKIGQPITDMWIGSGEINEQNGRGNAKFYFPVTGPKGAAEVTSQARKIDGKWGLSRVEVVFEGGEKHVLELDEKAGGGLDEAPPFVPPGELPRGSMPPDAGQ